MLGEDGSLYRDLLQKGLAYLEEKLYSGEYFFQQVEWQDLEAKLPEPNQAALNDKISPEAAELMREYGPKYQYGTGCLSDGVLGFWLARMSGLGDVGDSGKIRSHLRSVYRYNLRESLLEHANPQRPGLRPGRRGRPAAVHLAPRGQARPPLRLQRRGVDGDRIPGGLPSGSPWARWKWAWTSSGNAGAGTRAGCAIPLTSTSAATGMPAPWPPTPYWKP